MTSFQLAVICLAPLWLSAEGRPRQKGDPSRQGSRPERFLKPSGFIYLAFLVGVLVCNQDYILFGAIEGGPPFLKTSTCCARLYWHASQTLKQPSFSLCVGSSASNMKTPERPPTTPRMIFISLPACLYVVDGDHTGVASLVAQLRQPSLRAVPIGQPLRGREDGPRAREYHDGAGPSVAKLLPPAVERIDDGLVPEAGRVGGSALHVKNLGCC